MALTRSTTITLGAVVAAVVAVGAVYVLSPGEEPEAAKAAVENVIRIEAAGIKYAGWPEMDVNVNGTTVASMTIDSQQRKMFTIDVPPDIGSVDTVELKFTNETDCQSRTACDNRKIIVRGLYLNDQKIEGAVATGGKNLASLLQSAEGGISWQVTR